MKTIGKLTACDTVNNLNNAKDHVACQLASEGQLLLKDVLYLN